MDVFGVKWLEFALSWGSVSRPSDGQNRKYGLSESLAPTLGALGESQARCAEENKAET